MRRRVTPDLTAWPVDDAASDAGFEAEVGPLRRCAVTRERLPKERMIRFVVGPERQIVPDLAARLPGRGIWLSARRDVLESARNRGAFAKAARGQVQVPPDLTSELQASLERRVGEIIGLARRAGQAVAGFGKAREWLAAGRAGLVVQASDGSPDERARFLAGWREKVPVIAPLDAAALGAVFGRDHAVHAVVGVGRLADMLREEAGRLAGIRAHHPDGHLAGSTKAGGQAAGRTTRPALPDVTNEQDAGA